MKLPNDKSRCTGGTETAQCEHRQACMRYLDRHTLGMWTPVHLRMCEDRENMIEAPAVAAPICPRCGNGRQVWKNQITGLLTCHRAFCDTVITPNDRWKDAA